MADKTISLRKYAGNLLRAAFGYDAARNTRYRSRRGVTPIRSEEVELRQYDRDRLISTCLDFRRNNPVVASISRLRKSDVVGRGIIPQPKTGSTDVDKFIEQDWFKWSESPEITGLMDMREMQQQMVDSWLFTGDCGLLLTNAGNGKVQFIDGSRIGNPLGKGTGSESDPMQNGVEINGIGRPIRYHIGRRVNGSLIDLRPVSARNFIPSFRRVRAIQYRGIPELAPVINTLQDCDEYDRIEMIAAKCAASLSVAVKRHDSHEFGLSNRRDDQDQDSIGGLETFEPGKFHYLEPDEDVSVISSSNRPNVDGIAFVSYLLRKIGSPLGIPLEFLLMEIGGSSFSASQGVVLQYQQSVESAQNDLIRSLSRLYRRRLEWMIGQNLISQTDAPNLFGVRWQRPQFRWINRAAQVKADLEYYRLGAMSIDDVVAPFGYTAEEVLERKAQNIEMARDIAEKHKIVNWRELINPNQTFITAPIEDIDEKENENGDNDDTTTEGNKWLK